MPSYSEYQAWLPKAKEANPGVSEAALRLAFKRDFGQIDYSDHPDVSAAKNPPVNPETTNQIAAGFGTALDQLQGTGYGLAAMAGDMIDSDGLRNWGLEGYSRNMEEAQNNGLRVQNFSDIDSFDSALDWTAGALGQSLPSMGAVIAGGGVGGFIAKKGAEKAAKEMSERYLRENLREDMSDNAKALVRKSADDIFRQKMAGEAVRKQVGRGQIAGGMAVSTGMGTGGIYGGAADENPEMAEGASTILASIAGGTVVGALDAIVPMQIAKRFGMGDDMGSFMQDRIAQSPWYKQIALGGLKAGSVEAMTEAAQTLVEELTKAYILERGLPEDIGTRMLDAGAIGFVGGGTVGGATAPFGQQTVEEAKQAREARIANDEALRYLEDDRTLSADGDIRSTVQLGDLPAPRPLEGIENTNGAASVTTTVEQNSQRDLSNAEQLDAAITDAIGAGRQNGREGIDIDSGAVVQMRQSWDQALQQLSGRNQAVLEQAMWEQQAAETAALNDARIAALERQLERQLGPVRPEMERVNRRNDAEMRELEWQDALTEQERARDRLMFHETGRDLANTAPGAQKGQLNLFETDEGRQRARLGTDEFADRVMGPATEGDQQAADRFRYERIKANPNRTDAERFWMREYEKADRQDAPEIVIEDGYRARPETVSFDETRRRQEAINQGRINKRMAIEGAEARSEQPSIFKEPQVIRRKQDDQPFANKGAAEAASRMQRLNPDEWQPVQVPEGWELRRNPSIMEASRTGLAERAVATREPEERELGGGGGTQTNRPNFQRADNPRSEANDFEALTADTADNFTEKDAVVLEMVNDHLATLREQRVPPSDTKFQRYQKQKAELEAKRDGVRPVAGEIMSSQVYGHPQATNVNADKNANLIPIKVRDKDTVDRYLQRAQARLDELQSEIGTLHHGLKQNKYRGVNKEKQKARLDELEFEAGLIRSETMPELERLYKEAPEKPVTLTRDEFERTRGDEEVEVLYETEATTKTAKPKKPFRLGLGAQRKLREGDNTINAMQLDRYQNEEDRQIAIGTLNQIDPNSKATVGKLLWRDPETGKAELGRSNNPEWYQELPTTAKVSTQEAHEMMRKLKAGEELGSLNAKQARFLSEVMNQVDKFKAEDARRSDFMTQFAEEEGGYTMSEQEANAFWEEPTKSAEQPKKGDSYADETRSAPSPFEATNELANAAAARRAELERKTRNSPPPEEMDFGLFGSRKKEPELPLGKPRADDDLGPAYSIPHNRLEERKAGGDPRISNKELDAKYTEAVNSGDIETAQQMVKEAAEAAGVPVITEEGVTAYEVRRGKPPQKTHKAYKLFRVKRNAKGEVFALFVGANDPLPQGVWLDAKAGPQAADSKTGKQKVKSKLGPLAYRPGWHGGDIPLATHIGAKQDKSGPIIGRKEDEVWAEVEVAADVDYQPEANANGSKKDGTFSPALADIKYMPEGGMYRYKTNPNMTGNWIISGSMKINRILSESEVNKLLEDAGQEPMSWTTKTGPKEAPYEIAPLNLARWGLDTNPAVNQKKLLDAVTYDDAGGVIPLSQRFNRESTDPRYRRSTDPTAGTSAKADQVREWVEKPIQRLAEWVEVTVLDKAPADKAPDALGYYDNGKAYLIAENIKSAKEAKQTLVHEVVGHLGIETLLGSKAFREDGGKDGWLVRMIQQQKRMGNSEIDQIVETLKKNYVDDDGNYLYENNPMQEAREVIAHLAESDTKHSLIKQVIAKLRLILAKMGLGNYDNAFLKGLIADAARMVEGQAHSVVIDSSGTVVYAKKAVGKTREAIDVLRSNSSYMAQVRKRYPALKAEIAKHRGSPWAKSAEIAMVVDYQMQELIDGNITAAEATALSGRVPQLLEDRGNEGVWDYLDSVDLISDSAKPDGAVNSSFKNCEPSKNCAKFCYAADGRLGWSSAIQKQELMDRAARENPQRLAKMIAKEFKRENKRFWTSKALRMLDTGELNSDWVTVVNELTKIGITTQTFSKKPELLRQIDARNVRLLSIDTSNAHLAESAAGRDLDLAITYTGKESADVFNRFADRFNSENGKGVILPIENKRNHLSEDELQYLDADMRKHICPVGAGKWKGDAAVGACVTCQKGVGCFRNQAVEYDHLGGITKVNNHIKGIAVKIDTMESATDEQLDRTEAELLNLLEKVRAKRAATADSGQAVRGLDRDAAESSSREGQTQGDETNLGDESDLGAAFSRRSNTPEAADSVTSRIGKWLNDSVKSAGKTLYNEQKWSLLTQRQIADVVYKQLPDVKDRYQKLVDAYATAKNDIQFRAGRIANDRRKMTREQNDSLSELQHAVTIMGLELDGHSFVPADQNEPAYERADVLDRINSQWRTLNDAQRQQYKDERDFHVEMRQQIEDALLERVMQSNASLSSKEGVVARIMAEFGQNQIKGDYFPLARFGNYWVATEVRGVRHFDKFETEDAMLRFIKDVEQEAQTAEGRPVKVTGNGRTIDRETMDGSVDPRFLDAVDDVLSGLDPVTDAGKIDEARDAIYQAYLNSLPEMSAKRSAIHRKKTPGFYKDQMRSFAKKALHDSMLLARLRYGAQMRQVLDDQVEITEAAGSINRRNEKQQQIDDIEAYLQSGFDDYTVEEMRDAVEQARLDLQDSIDGDNDDLTNEYFDDVAAMEGYAQPASPETKRLEEQMQQMRRFLRLKLKYSRRDPGAMQHTPVNNPEFVAKWEDMRDSIDAMSEAEMLQAEQDRLNNILDKADIVGDRPARAQNAINELQKGFKNLMNPNMHPLAQAVNQLGFTWFLGFTPAAALVNLSQTPMVSMPMAAAKYGWSDTRKEFGKAFKEFTKTENGEWWDLAGMGKHMNLTTEEEAAFDRAFREGVLDTTLAHDLAGFADEGIDTGDFKHRLMKASAFFFHNAERANRYATFIASYRLAKRRGGSDNEAFQSAHDITWGSHMDYASHNRARVMRGNWMRVFTQFKQYSQGITYIYAKTAYDAYKSPHVTPEEREIAKRTIKGMLGLQLLIGGTAGMFGAGVVTGMAQAAADAFGDEDDPRDIAAEWRKMLADTVGETGEQALTKGIFNGLTPLDIGSRVSLKDLWLRTSDRELEGADKAYDLYKNLLGPTIGGIGSNVVVGMDLMLDGEVQRGAEKMVPKVVSDQMKAFRYATEDAKTMRGYDVKEVGAAEVVGKMLGFSSSDMNDLYSQNTAISNITVKLGERRQDLVDQMVQARKDRRLADIQKVQQAINKWNRTNPQARITKDNIRASMRGRDRTAAEMNDGLRVPKRYRDVQEELRIER